MITNLQAAIGIDGSKMVVSLQSHVLLEALILVIQQIARSKGLFVMKKVPIVTADAVQYLENNSDSSTEGILSLIVRHEEQLIASILVPDHFSKDWVSLEEGQCFESEFGLTSLATIIAAWESSSEYKVVLVQDVYSTAVEDISLFASDTNINSSFLGNWYYWIENSVPNRKQIDQLLRCPISFFVCGAVCSDVNSLFKRPLEFDHFRGFFVSCFDRDSYMVLEPNKFLR
jgi:hypothetical protein